MKKQFVCIGVLIVLAQVHELSAQSVCEEPNSTPQAIWREGLQNPIGDRIGLKTTHVVIHHSSDPNLELEDYTPLVRNIYVYHTQNNGWDDIGYNYLIDPKGVIYKGRDPKGNASQDEVEGAHMCNKNENTMGICMIGTFINVLPTRAALKALYTLVGWKIRKDDISVFGNTTHAIGPTSANLPPMPLSNICGHKDGCQSGYTECPGDLFHSTFDELRDSVSLYSYKCGVSYIETEELEQFRLFSLGGQTRVIPPKTYQEIKIYNLQGQLLLDQNFSDEVSTQGLPNRELLLVVLTGGDKELFRFKFINP